MSDQTLDLRRSMQLLRRHKFVVAAFAALGLAAGCALAVLSPSMLTSDALVVLPPSVHNASTQVVIAGSDPVLAGALHNTLNQNEIQALRGEVRVKSLTTNILSVSAQGKTADEAQDRANAVAGAYVAYVGSPKRGAGQVQAHLLEQATNATGTSLSSRLTINGITGVLAGLLIGIILVLAISRKDRRLRERDEIADSIGVPVLMSIQVAHPSNAAGWTKLLDGYQPRSVDSWRLRKTLRQLGLSGQSHADLNGGSGSSISVLSLASDPKALALGPQLAVFAASLGIPTVLVIGPQQDPNTTATLRAVCAAPPESSRRPENLRLAVSDHAEAPDRLPGAGLIVTVAVVDGQTPRVADTMRATVTVLGVTAGKVTAEELARVAISAATEGRDITGILVADPDSADHTTGRLPEVSRPGQRRMPTRVTGISTGTKR